MDNQIRLTDQIHTTPAYDAPAREAVGLFTDVKDLQEAVRELEGAPFPRDSITVLGSRKDVREHFGTSTVDPIMAEDDPHAPRQAPVRPEEKTIAASALVGCAAYVGVVSATLVAAPVLVPGSLAAIALAGGGGAAIGGVLVKLMGDKFDKNIEEQVSRGGLLLWVRTPDSEREAIACDILRRHGATHINVHDIIE